MRLLELDSSSYRASRGIINHLKTCVAMKATEDKTSEQPTSPTFPGVPSTTVSPSSSFQPWISEPPKPVVHQAQWSCDALADVHVTLENSDMWNRFYAVGNEMIITRPGRRMFPVMRVIVNGMDPKVYYMVLMDLTPMDNFRYRFLGNCWLPVEPATEISPGEGGSLYLHENGPCVGSKWMMAPVDFGTVKLTNQKSTTPQQIMLQSMRKYVPRIHIFAGSDVQQLDYRRFKTFVFPETAFITVTSYQNDQIITLKIQNNPYARSFFSNADRRNSRRLVEEESASAEDGTGRDSADKAFHAPSTSCTGTATTVEQRLPTIASSLSSGYAASAVPSLHHAWAQCTTSQHLFAPHGPTDLGWYSPLYGLAQELQYATTPAVMGQSYRPYVPSPYMNVATAPEFSPFYLRSLLDGSRSASSPVVTPPAAPVSSATVSSPLSASSAMSRPCATPATPASSLEALSTASLLTAPLRLFRNTTTSSHTQNNSFSPS